MARLLRPHIPIEVRCRVVLRQIGEMWPDRLLEEARSCSLGIGHILDENLMKLAEHLGCSTKDLHLDHHPALAVRKKIHRRGVHVGYVPAANDPEFLLYREKHDHHIKTQVRGDGAQFPDRVLIKRERRRQKKKVSKPLKRDVRFRQKIKAAKRPWPSRPFPKRVKP